MDFVYFLAAWGVIGMVIGLAALHISRKLARESGEQVASQGKRAQALLALSMPPWVVWSFSFQTLGGLEKIA